MSFLITKIIRAFLLPPLNVLVLSGVGFLVLKRHPRLGHALLIVSWLLLFTLSIPLVGRNLRGSLENTSPLRVRDVLNKADAIVVLGGGVYLNAPEYGRDTVTGTVLERLRYAARLHRLTGKPILVTGGKPQKATLPEGEVMKEALENDFGVPVQWVEAQSSTTRENAYFSAAILQPHDIRRIYLVTHAMHMPRAQAVFEHAGFHVVPAPTMYVTVRSRLTLFDFLPSSSVLAVSYNALHEWIGRLWYWVREENRHTGEERGAFRGRFFARCCRGRSFPLSRESSKSAKGAAQKPGCPPARA
jgi:uncharacterized SAM-binding protein YcdF (DUF218 family)